MRWEERITIDPKVLAGKPVVKGTRLAVEFIVDLLAQGWTEAQILENYRGIVREDIRACLQYASEMLKSERAFPASVGGRSVTAFVVNNVQEAETRTIGEFEILNLRDEASEVFVDAVLHPPAPNDAARSAAHRYRENLGR